MHNYASGPSYAPRTNSSVKSSFTSSNTFSKLMAAQPELQTLLLHLVEYEVRRARHLEEPFNLRAVTRRFLAETNAGWGWDHTSAGKVRNAERYNKRFIEWQWHDPDRSPTSHAQIHKDFAAPVRRLPVATPVETSGAVVVKGPNGTVRVPFDHMKVQFTLCLYTRMVTHCEIQVPVQQRPSHEDQRELMRPEPPDGPAVKAARLLPHAPARDREA